MRVRRRDRDCESGMLGLAAGAVATVCISPPAGAAVEYRVELLQSITPAAGYAWARAVNNSGTVAGDAARTVLFGQNVYPAVRWASGTSSPTELGNLGIADGFGWGINDAGDVVGYVSKQRTPVQIYQPARWVGGGTAITVLGTASVNGYARAINNHGDIAGYASDSTSGTRAVRWAAGGTVATYLGNLGTSTSGASSSFAYAINNSGDAAGFAEKYLSGTSLGTRAVRWSASGTAAIELPNLSTSSSGIANALANSINDTGDIVGQATIYSGTNALATRAVLWAAGADATVAVELPNLVSDDGSGVPNTWANAINNDGDIVGRVESYINGKFSLSGAALWRHGATSPILLNDLIDPQSGWALNEAMDISDTGVIVGRGGYGAGHTIVGQFRLVPIVPEPQVPRLALVASCFLSRRLRRRREPPGGTAG